MALPPSTTASQTMARIATRLHEIFDGLIDLADVSGKSAEHIEGFFLTRSLAALALLSEAGLTSAQAADSVTDGGTDDGIDALCIDKAKNVIYFVQSKWRSATHKGVGLEDFTRFRDGVKAVIDMEWTKDNSNLHRFKGELEKALSNIDTRVAMILVHTSEQPIAKNIQTKIDKFKSEQNSIIPDFLDFREFKLSEAAQTARFQARPENINVSALLEQWGKVREPYEALYGSIQALDVVRWYADHGNRLFAENLRFSIDRSSVNDGIIKTAEDGPENFWYFNNGITAICESIDKQPIGGNSTDKGVFDIKRISVINGAQTIGSLNRAKNNGSSMERARVHIRIISLADTPDGFATNVTNANNTQNDLSPVDFVAADPTQERLRKEASALGLTYSYRRGEPEPAPKNGFDIRSVTIASACASGDIKVAVTSKRYISGLWENTKKEPYTLLFNENTSASKLWYYVGIMRAVDKELAELAKSLSGRDKLVAVHGNRFILYYVFEILKGTGVFNKLDLSGTIVVIKQTVRAVLEQIMLIISTDYAEAYPGNVFKNTDRQIDILGKIL